MIQQHCYSKTEEKSGTAARSPGLSEDFIAEYLLPLSYYHPSKKMQALRVPAEEFPRALSLAYFPGGEMVISQTVYTEPGFFTHQYIFNESLPELAIPLLYHTLFLTATDWDQLEELETLPLIEQKSSDINAGPLPFDDMRLMQLADILKAGRKAYVILPDLEWVRPMLTWLYNHLPENTAFGFTTYSREPVNNNFLQLVFLEKGSMQFDDPGLQQDYVFDFDSGNFSKNLPS